jgi:hypothetical protein
LKQAAEWLSVHLFLLSREKSRIVAAGSEPASAAVGARSGAPESFKK